MGVRYDDIGRFKGIAELLSPAKRLEVDKAIKDYKEAATAVKEAGDAAERETGERILSPAQIEHFDLCQQKLEYILYKLNEAASELSKSNRTYSMNPRKFVQNCKNLCAAFDELITVTGDKSLNREIKKIEAAFKDIKEGAEDNQSKARAILNAFIKLLPKLYNAAKTFIQDLAVTIKASYHQVEGYNNIVSKASKKIWKPKN